MSTSRNVWNVTCKRTLYRRLGNGMSTKRSETWIWAVIVLNVFRTLKFLGQIIWTVFPGRKLEPCCRGRGTALGESLFEVAF